MVLSSSGLGPDGGLGGVGPVVAGQDHPSLLVDDGPCSMKANPG